MTQTGTPADQAAATLAAEGYDMAEVLAAIDSLIEAGLELEQPDDMTVLSEDEIGVVRAQLEG